MNERIEISMPVLEEIDRAAGIGPIVRAEEVSQLLNRSFLPLQGLPLTPELIGDLRIEISRFLDEVVESEIIRGYDIEVDEVGGVNIVLQPASEFFPMMFKEKFVLKEVPCEGTNEWCEMEKPKLIKAIYERF